MKLLVSERNICNNVCEVESMLWLMSRERKSAEELAPAIAKKEEQGSCGMSTFSFARESLIREKA